MDIIFFVNAQLLSLLPPLHRLPAALIGLSELFNLRYPFLIDRRLPGG